MNNLRDEAKKLGIDLDEIKVAAFETYLRELTEWNTKHNLTAITEEGDIILKHFVDSLSLSPLIPEGVLTLIDVGSGAGFPGIPLKIIRPDIEVTLLEATAKKVAFLEHIISILGLSGISVVHARAEDIGSDAEYREQFDVAVARAVANMSTLSEITLPLVKIGGMVIAQKVLNETEIENALHAITELGGQSPILTPARIEKLSGHGFVIIRKIATTPEKYPRRPGLPLKRPLM